MMNTSRMTYSWIALALLMALAAAPGCNTPMFGGRSAPPPVAEPNPLDSQGGYMAPVAPESGLALSTSQRFKDVPLPVKVTEDLERTFVFESTNLQVGRLVYTSRASLPDLVNFYIRQAPTSGWTLQDVLEAGGKTLVFTKPGKRLTVTVQQRGTVKGRRLILTLTPEGGGSPLL